MGASVTYQFSGTVAHGPSTLVGSAHVAMPLRGIDSSPTDDRAWDHDEVATFVCADAAVKRPVSGTRAAVVHVRLAKPSAVPIEVDYATIDGTAHAGTDYQATSGTLTFAPGQRKRTLNVPILANPQGHQSRNFTVQLLGEGGAALDLPRAHITIEGTHGGRRPRSSASGGSKPTQKSTAR